MVRFASFGAGGMGWRTLDQIATHPNTKLVCVAEVDAANLDNVKRKHPSARTYEDWRQLLKDERGEIDAACVSTPDHMHAPIAMSAMHQGIHVFVEKPLTHDLFESRRLAEMAASSRVITQMGIQNHSVREYRTAAALIQTGAIGKIREVHCWSDKKWGDTGPLPPETGVPPATLNWDLWLGVAPARPYIGNQYYHPLNWRKRMDFGTATFGDMGCHILDPVFTALQLTSPLQVRSAGPAPVGGNWAVNTILDYTFPGTSATEEGMVRISWYDGQERPPRTVISLLGRRTMPEQASLFIGTKGAMLVPHVRMPVLLPRRDFRDFRFPACETDNHYHEWVDAILGKSKTAAAFDYSGRLTETILIGLVATRFPNTTLEWNAAAMQFTNSPAATNHVRRQYRAGWNVAGLSEA